MNILFRIKELFTKKVISVWTLQLSNPKVKRPKFNSSIGITKKVLEDNPEARDDKELFIQIISCHTEKFSELENFSRSWRYVQQHFPELRGKNWEQRQRKAKYIRKNI